MIAAILAAAAAAILAPFRPAGRHRHSYRHPGTLTQQMRWAL